MPIHAEVRGADEVAGRLGNTAARQQIIRQGLEAHLALIHGAVVPLTPVGVTSALRGSWISDAPQVGPTSFLGVLGSPLAYADVMERGRRVGATVPPPDALAAWFALRFGEDPWGGLSEEERKTSAVWYTPVGRLALSISRKGIEGRHMLQRAIEATQGPAQAVWDAVGARLIPES
jgi:hypothetical protein